MSQVTQDPDKGHMQSTWTGKPDAHLPPLLSVSSSWLIASWYDQLAEDLEKPILGLQLDYLRFKYKLEMAATT